MKWLRIVAVIGILVIAGTTAPALARIVTREEARVVAQHWTEVITAINGNWAGSTTPFVGDVRELDYEGRTVGYLCSVEPRGFVVVPLLKGLAPVRVYSDESDLDPAAVGGPSDLVRGRMAMVLDEIEKALGPIEHVRARDLAEILDVEYSSAWESLLAGSGGMTRDYQEGEVLVTSIWNQFPPYNDQCPDRNCGWPSCPDYQNDHAFVGCVALAGSQIMEYWSWPPYGSWSPYSDAYDWGNMPDELTCYAEETSQAEVDAVAELCSEVGQAANMNYNDGCNVSTSDTGLMAYVYRTYFRYSGTCGTRPRRGSTA